MSDKPDTASAHRKRSWRSAVSRGVFTAAGLLLMVAAALKAHQLATQPVDDRIWQSLQLIGEWVLGVWLVSGVFRRVAWVVGIIVFAVFAAVSLDKGLADANSCGCFGLVQVNPWVTFSVDVVVVLLLAGFRPRKAEPEGGGTPARWARPAAAAALVLLGGVGGWVYAQSYQPGQLQDDGTVVFDAEHVFLEPDTWMGKSFPLLAHIGIRSDLAAGRWDVLLYHEDCPSCREVIGQLLDQPRAVNSPKLAMIVVPPYSGESVLGGRDASHVAFGVIKGDRQWFVPTPVILRLVDGKVVHVRETAEYEQAAGDEQVAKKQSPQPPEEAPQGPIEEPLAIDLTEPKLEVDFGYIEPESTHTGRFILSNDSEKHVFIRRIDSECKCTTVDEQPKAIPAGQSVRVPFTFVAPADRTNYAKRVVLYTKDNETKPIVCTLRARIGLPLRADPAVIDLGDIGGVVPSDPKITLHNDGDKPVPLLYALSSAPGLYAQVPRASIPAGGSIDIPLKIEPSELKAGTHTVNVTVHVDEPAQRSVGVRVKYRH